VSHTLGCDHLEPIDHALDDIAVLFRSCFSADTCERQLYDVPSNRFEDHLAQLFAGALAGSVDWTRSGGHRNDANDLIAAIVTTRPEPHMVWVAWLLVAPTHQRLGLGKQLLAAASAGTDPVRLSVTADSSAASFYKHLGFIEISEGTLYCHIN